METLKTDRPGAPLLNAWASTLPGDSGNLPRPGDRCAVEACPEVLKEGEEVYYAVEMPGETGRGLAVCWRHIQRETGEAYPVTIS